MTEILLKWRKTLINPVRLTASSMASGSSSSSSAVSPTSTWEGEVVPSVRLFCLTSSLSTALMEDKELSVRRLLNEFWRLKIIELQLLWLLLHELLRILKELRGEGTGRLMEFWGLSALWLLRGRWPLQSLLQIHMMVYKMYMYVFPQMILSNSICFTMTAIPLVTVTCSNLMQCQYYWTLNWCSFVIYKNYTYFQALKL